MDESFLEVVDQSLQRCTTQPQFLDLFYRKFLAASPKVREKFETTDFRHQKRALRASLHLMLIAAQEEEKGPERYLRDLAHLHGAQGFDIGAELYDLWLDCLLETVAETDPQFEQGVRDAWERVMMVGIRYMCTRYHH
jgi:hemoglobin-like flavoprotein